MILFILARVFFKSETCHCQKVSSHGGGAKDDSGIGTPTRPLAAHKCREGAAAEQQPPDAGRQQQHSNAGKRKLGSLAMNN
ncbi:uncharacterized protein LOC120661460 isoform X7 [Panicum virgatum]|uniref:uncharacterized protein LOC120661460 isoform X7 n=1 Tax=Panicum virgatum TaxID=38727 RepID=UPI0019D54A15|nr:uncharacterized protein LOC120661460 isoform X7 [Panicum virgatum]XP_039796270.1 uncharacterized protein LOC120661460 isoform X7 [Panicum virgatum]